MAKCRALQLCAEPCRVNVEVSAAAPPPATKAVPEFDSVLFETLREKHSAFNTDACRVVILAGQEVVNHFGDNPDPLFPNAIAWIKDHTHAARRSPVFFDRFASKGNV